MEYPISISTINDFIFCPVSIYFHLQYDDTKNILYQNEKQINGLYAHSTIDDKRYSTSTNILQSIDVYSEKYNLIGKIDTFNLETKELTERKKHIAKIYDGYVFQLYAQYFSLVEMGYEVDKLSLYSYDDNKKYYIDLPDENLKMLGKFEQTINDMNTFNPFDYEPQSFEKCNKCIYSNICDRSRDND